MVHISPKGISPKVNTIARLEFELADHDVTVQYVSFYATEISPDYMYYVYYNLV